MPAVEMQALPVAEATRLDKIIGDLRERLVTERRRYGELEEKFERSSDEKERTALRLTISQLSTEIVILAGRLERAQSELDEERLEQARERGKLLARNEKLVGAGESLCKEGEARSAEVAKLVTVFTPIATLVPWYKRLAVAGIVAAVMFCWVMGCLIYVSMYPSQQTFAVQSLATDSNPNEKGGPGTIQWNKGSNTGDANSRSALLLTITTLQSQLMMSRNTVNELRNQDIPVKGTGFERFQILLTESRPFHDQFPLSALSMTLKAFAVRELKGQRMSYQINEDNKRPPKPVLVRGEETIEIAVWLSERLKDTPALQLYLEETVRMEGLNNPNCNLFFQMRLGEGSTTIPQINVNFSPSTMQFR